MAKKILENLEEDIKDLGIVEGRPLIIGSTDDRGVVGKAQPELEVNAAEWKALMGNKSTKTSIDYWDANRMIRVH